jgi:hypothetical protein
MNLIVQKSDAFSLKKGEALYVSADFRRYRETILLGAIREYPDM